MVPFTPQLDAKMVEMAQQGAQSEQYARRIEELEQSLGSALNQGARAAELEQKLAEATLALENNKQVVALSRKIEEIEGRSQMDLRNWEKKNAEMTVRGGGGTNDHRVVKWNIHET